METPPLIFLQRSQEGVVIRGIPKEGWKLTLVLKQQ